MDFSGITRSTYNNQAPLATGLDKRPIDERQLDNDSSLDSPNGHEQAQDVASEVDSLNDGATVEGQESIAGSDIDDSFDDNFDDSIDNKNIKTNILGRFNSLEKDNKEIYEKYNASLKENERINEIILKLQDDLTGALERENSEKNKNNKLESETKSLSTNNKTLSAEKKTLSAENKTLSAENKTLSAENKTLSAENKTFSAEKERLSAENKRLSAEKESLFVKNKCLSVEKESLSVEIEKLKKRIERREEAIKKREDLINKYRAEKRDIDEVMEKDKAA